jgi:hypothetical protein
VSPITPEVALELFKENNNWYGSPALLRVSPALVADSSRDYIIDGSVRFEALRKIPHLLAQWQAGKMPHLVFANDCNRASGTLKVLPRMLALAGHYHRAYNETPPMWRECSADIRAYLSLPASEALAVFANRHRERKAFVRNVHKTDPVMANRTLIRRIKQLIITADETGTSVNIDTIRKVLFNDVTP